MKHYIGLDAHSKSCTFVALDENGKVSKEGSFPTSEGRLKALTQVFGVDPIEIVLEETNISHWIYNVLKPLCDKVVVCHAAHLPKKSGPKTDYRDALHLARQLRSDNLTPVHHDDLDGLMELRSVVRGYQTIVDSIVEQKSRMQALLRSEGVPYKKTKSYQRQKDQFQKMASEHKRVIATRTLEHIVSLEKIKMMYYEDFHNNRYRNEHIRNLRSIPGIGPIRSHVIAAYITTAHRFADKHKLWSYARLVRHHNVSDGIVYSTRTPPGRNELKNAFMGAALRIIVSNSENRLKHFYIELTQKKMLEPKKARKALARKIAAICLAVMKHGVKYNDQLIKDIT